MENFDFFITEDGSVGLYDNETKDIFHSRTGALKESIDKFIMATDFKNFCSQNNFVNVLDICFGIGYNSKSAIYFAIKSNKEINIKICALEISKEVSYISPFIKDSEKFIDVKIFLLAYFLSNYDDYHKYILNYLNTNSIKYKQFLDASICRLFDFYILRGYINTSFDNTFALLHNIYYQNVSNSMKSYLNVNNINKIDFQLILDDARHSIQSINNSFDFVFHDGFTPHKQPLLWSYEFLEKININPSGILSTYSNCTPVRNSLKKLGYYLGKIIIDEKQFGTVASFDKSKIKNSLSDFDIGLMNTKAGIPYRDKNLSLSSKEILSNRNLEVQKSNKISSTKFKRNHENAKI